MKTAISIPDPLFNSVERMAHKLNVSRSEFFANAAKAYIDQVKNQSVTDRLNKIYSENRKELHLSKELSAMQASSIPGEKW
jgi:metal-responsive CopG/Arc/MetJ family transcriptional regulator